MPRDVIVFHGAVAADAAWVQATAATHSGDEGPDQRVCGKPRSTFDLAGSGQREVTTFVRV